jgi:hypothetical protein
MGFIDNATGALADGRIWLTAKDGRLQYRLAGSSENLTCAGYVGIIRGVRVRQKTYQGLPYSLIDVLLHDASDGAAPSVIITGSLIGSTGEPTVFGKMLTSRLASAGVMALRGEPVKITVWPSENNPSITCCTIRSATTDEVLGSVPLNEVPAHELRPYVERLVYAAIQHYGVIPDPHDGREESEGSASTITTESGGDGPLAQGQEVNHLPF